MAMFDGWFGLQGLFGQYRAKLSGGGQPPSISDPGPATVLVTPLAALQLGAVWACVRLISETIGTLPIGVYFKNAKGDREDYSEHGLYTLLHDSPNADMSAAEFWEAIVASLCLWGNGYAEKIYNVTGDLIALNFLRPDWMSAARNANGVRIYTYNDPHTGSRIYTEDHLFHVRGFGVGHDLGLSPIGVARLSIAASFSADTAARSSLERGVRGSGFLVVPGKPTETQRKGLREAYLEPITGPSASAAGAVLEQGMDWKPIVGIPSTDLQMLETRAFNVEEICRWFRVPPFMIGHSEKSTSWGTGLEQQTIGFLTYALRPYLTRIEQAIKKQLLKPAERANVYAEVNLDGLLRADSAGRAALYASASQNGWMSRNEIRAKENLPPDPDGDKLTVQSNLVPLSKLGETPPAETPPGFGLHQPPVPVTPDGGAKPAVPAAKAA